MHSELLTVHETDEAVAVDQSTVGEVTIAALRARALQQFRGVAGSRAVERVVGMKPGRIPLADSERSITLHRHPLS